MTDGFILSPCIFFFLNDPQDFAWFVQFVWRPCRESGIHVKWILEEKDKKRKNAVWMLRGPCWCCWRGFKQFFFFKRFAKKETQRGGKLAFFFDPTSLWLKSGSASSKGSRKRFQISFISVCGFMAQPFIPVIRQAVLDQTANKQC